MNALQKKRKAKLTYKLMFVGKSGVGKSSAIINLVYQQFRETNISTTGIDFLIKQYHHQNKDVKLELWDTSGQGTYKNITTSHLKKANCIVFTYSLIDMDSFEQVINSWLPLALQQCPVGTLYIFFGNKSDMLKPGELQKKEEEVLNRLQILVDKQKIEVESFVGNCKELNNEGINLMVKRIIQILVGKSDISSPILSSEYKVATQQQKPKSFIIKSEIQEEDTLKKKKTKKFLCF